MAGQRSSVPPVRHIACCLLLCAGWGEGERATGMRLGSIQGQPGAGGPGHAPCTCTAGAPPLVTSCSGPCHCRAAHGRCMCTLSCVHDPPPPRRHPSLLNTMPRGYACTTQPTCIPSCQSSFSQPRTAAMLPPPPHPTHTHKQTQRPPYLSSFQGLRNMKHEPEKKGPTVITYADGKVSPPQLLVFGSSPLWE